MTSSVDVIPATGRARSRRLATALGGNVVYSLTQAAALAVVTRSDNGASDAADFLLAQAVATPVAIFVSGRVRDRLATEGAPTPLVPRLLRIGWMSAAAFAVGSIGWLALADGQRSQVGIAILAANLAQVLASIHQGRAIRADRFAASSATNMALGVLSLLSFILGYRFGGLTTGAAILAISWLTLGAFLVIRVLADERDNPLPTSETNSQLSDDLLVGLAATAMVAQPSAARIGVSLADGAAGLATFGTTSQLARLGSLMVNGVKAAISPELANAVKAGTLDRYLQKLRLRIRGGVAVLCVIGFAGGWILGPGLIEQIFSDSVRPDRMTAALVFGLAPCLYAAMLLTQVAIAGQRNSRLTVAGVAGLAVTVSLIFPLASLMGASGAALALGLGNVMRYALLDQLLLPGSRRTA